MRNKDFYTKTIVMFLFILIALLLDVFVPDEFYNSLIDNIRVFKVIALVLVLAGLFGTILCKHDN